MADLKIGTVTHYYSNLNVAIIDLIGPLHVGDRVRISGKHDFSQLVESIQIEHEQVEAAQAGDCIGLKTTQAVEPGDEIVKLS